MLTDLSAALRDYREAFFILAVIVVVPAVVFIAVGRFGVFTIGGLDLFL